MRPRCFAVLAFDPSGKPSGPWQDFPARTSVLPQLLIRVHDEKAEFLTSADGESSLVREAMRILERPPTPAPSHIATGGDCTPREEWFRVVQSVRAEIRAGRVEKVVLARASWREGRAALPTGTILERLSAQSQDCFLFAYHCGSSAFLGASPERLFRTDRRHIESESLAGTCPRGATPEEDEALAHDLLHSTKDLVEHALVTDFLKNTLSRFCMDVQADSEPTVQRLPTVQHLRTGIRGSLNEGVTLDQLLAALHPTPAVCGVPREHAHEFISRFEKTPRGLYAGAFGWTDGENAKFAVSIRSALLKGRRAYVFAGAGIIAGSDPAAEWEETMLKMQPMLRALEG
jgi:isochorismate synthase